MYIFDQWLVNSAAFQEWFCCIINIHSMYHTLSLVYMVGIGLTLFPNIHGCEYDRHIIQLTQIRCPCVPDVFWGILQCFDGRLQLELWKHWSQDKITTLSGEPRVAAVTILAWGTAACFMLSAYPQHSGDNVLDRSAVLTSLISGKYMTKIWKFICHLPSELWRN